MSIIPDLIPLPTPSSLQIDLSLTFPSSGVHDPVPGDYLLPSQTTEQPKIDIQSFTTDETEQLYTLIMVDPDYPDPENFGFREYCHWLVPNIPISRHTTTLPLSTLTPLLDYQPPHPSPLTPYRRYTLLLVRQPAPTVSTTSSTEESQNIDLNATTSFLPTLPESSARETFNTRHFLLSNKYTTSLSSADPIFGIFMFRQGGKRFGNETLKPHQEGYKREEEVVRGIWRDVRGREEPRWVRVEKGVRYGMPGRGREGREEGEGVEELVFA